MAPDSSKLDALKIDHEKRAGSRFPVVWAAVAALVLAGATAVWLLARPSASEVEVAAAQEVVLGERSTVLNLSLIHI